MVGAYWVFLCDSLCLMWVPLVCVLVSVVSVCVVCRWVRVSLVEVVVCSVSSSVLVRCWPVIRVLVLCSYDLVCVILVLLVLVLSLVCVCLTRLCVLVTLLAGGGIAV